MYKIIFLICLAIIWISFAVVQDLRKREIANWLNFSLIIFAIGFRFFYCLFSEQGFGFFYQGLIGFGIFFVLGNLLYYGRMFAGGDAKLFFALGAVLPFSIIFAVNLNIFILFLFLFLFAGGVYGLFSAGFLISKNFKKFKKEFSKQFKHNKKLFLFTIFLGLIFMLFGFVNFFIFYFGILFFIFPYLYLCAKSVDEVCMIKKISPKNLTQGDWLYKDVKVGNKIIKKNWDGLTKKEINFFQIIKIVLIRQGIRFSPLFLVSFLVLVYVWFKHTSILI